MTPLQIALGGLTLMVGLLALAQKFGGWQNKSVARCLGATAGGVFVAWCFLLFPTWIGWVAVAVFWSIGLWFIVPWARGSVDTMLAPRSERTVQLNQELFNTRAQLADAKNELSRRDAAQAEAQQETILLKHKLREAEHELAIVKQRFLDDAPSLIVRYGHAAGIRPMLTLINDNEKAAVSAEFDPPFLMSKESNGGVFRHELMTIPPVVSLIERNKPEQCELMMKDVKRNAVCPLEDVLSRETTGTVDTVTLNYNDSVGREFARDFTLRRHIDGSVEWKPLSIRLRGPNAAP